MRRWTRLLLAAVTVTAVAVVVGAVSVPRAAAYINEPYMDPAFEPQLQQLLDGTLRPVVPPADVSTTFAEAAQAAGRIPWIGAGVGTFFAGVAAFDVGWKIGRVIDTKWLHLEDPNCVIFGCNNSSTATHGGSTGYPWVQGFVNGSGGCAVLPASAGGGTMSCAIAEALEAPNNSGTPSLWGSCPNCYSATDFYDYGTPPAQAVPLKGDAVWNSFVANGYVPVLACDAAHAGDCGAPSTATLNGIWRLYKPASAAVANGLAPGGLQTYGNQAADITTTMASPGPTKMTASQASAARTIIGSDSAARAWANCELDPADYACPGTKAATSGNSSSGGTSTGGAVVTRPIVLPSPLPDEDYESYAGRLREAGWDGQIVEVPDPNTYPDGSPAKALDPGAVTGVRVGATGAFTPLYDPTLGTQLHWPVNGPSATPGTDTEIDLQVTPGSPGTGSGGTGIRFPPITTPCNVFPFGVLCWAGSIVASFNAAPVAPGIDWKAPTITSSVAPGIHIGEYDVELTYFNGFMSTIREMISWVLWVGAVWFVGSRMIGLRAGGDPSDGVESAYDPLID